MDPLLAANIFHQQASRYSALGGQGGLGLGIGGIGQYLGASYHPEYSEEYYEEQRQKRMLETDFNEYLSDWDK